MSRIDNIAKFAQKREEAQISNEQLRLQQIVEYKDKIKALKPRIDELLEVGNACLEYNIPLEGYAWGGREGYDTHQFITNSWSHLLGFVQKRKKSFTKLGIQGDGACDYELETDGITVNVSGRDVLWVLKRFVNEFDEFETEFYKYVDKVTAGGK